MSRDEDFSSRFKPGADVLQSLFENGKSSFSDQFLRWKLWAQWNEIVGPSVAQHCEPVSLQFGHLQIWVKSSAWMQQLVFLKGDILNRIHERYPHRAPIHKISFTLDRRSVPEDTDTRENIKKVLPEIVKPGRNSK
jgi:hypothetical protein